MNIDCIRFDERENIFYIFDDVFDVFNDETLANKFDVDDIEIENDTKMIFFIDKKKRKFDDREHVVVVNKFYNVDLFDSIVLNIIDINSKTKLNVLINVFDLIIDF